jgi:uncharacterized protein YbjT (DUF2867 family)
MKIVVLGGSGFIGRHVCEKLAAQGHSITVPTRRLSSAAHLIPLPRLQLQLCDVHNSAQLAQVVAGHDVLINLVAVLHGNAQRFEAVHVQLPRSIVAACHAGGVGRVVHVSALGAALDAPSMYQRSKAQGEAVLAGASTPEPRKAGTSLDVRILRPSVVFGAEDKLLNLFASLQKIAPFMPLAGADTQFQPVWVEDVAQAVLQLASTDRLPQGSQAADSASNASVFEACGPQVLTLRELVQLAGRSVGAQRPVFSLPAPLARLQAFVMEHLPGEPLMSRDNLDSMRVANIASGQLPGLEQLGITPSSITAIAPTYLSAARTMDGYRKHASRS